jgi:hypothetical protein
MHLYFCTGIFSIPAPVFCYSGKGQISMREFYAYVWRSSALQQIVRIILAVIAALLGGFLVSGIKASHSAIAEQFCPESLGRRSSMTRNYFTKI